MKQMPRAFILFLSLALSFLIALPAFSASPQFETPVQSLESSQLKHIGAFDKDSLPDLLLVFQNKIFYRKGLGNGAFESPITSTLDVQIFNSTFTAVGDLTGDSIEDFVFVVPFGKHLEIYQGSAQGSFSLYRSIELDYSINKPIIGNFNADSYPDLLITSTSIWGGNYFLEGTVSGISGIKIEYKEGFYPNGFRCDVSRMAKISPTGSPAFLCLGSTSIGIIPMNSATQPGIINGYSSPYTSYPVDQQYAIADFSGDGLLDLAALRGNSNSPSLLIYENSSLGLNSPRTISLGSISWQDRLLASDIDGDGRNDLILFKPNSQTLYSLNLGGLKFQPLQSLQTNLSNENLAIADVNGDNLGDLIFSGNNRISVAITKNMAKQEADAKAAADKAVADAKAAADKAVADDAVREATDSANAATDAANVAASSSSVSLLAAQSASDVVVALSTQVDEIISSLKAQVASLSALILKIQAKLSR